MIGKLSLLAGAATGYVLGAKAGHRRYEQIMGRLLSAWASAPVQAKVDTAKEAVRTKAPMMAGRMSEAAKFTGPKFKTEATSEDLIEPANRGADGKAHADFIGFEPGPGQLA